MNKPLVSVLIPVYNAKPYLRDALESITKQTYSNLEILVIDDGSKDNSLSVIKDINDSRIRIYRKENKGRATALNLGIEELNGEFYTTQDADDISYPNRIEKLVKTMLNNPKLAGIFSGHDLIIGSHRIAPTFGMKNSIQCKKDVKQMRMPAHDPTGMYRMDYVNDIRYEESLKMCAGYDYILRVGEKFPLVVSGNCLYSYRIHSNATTRKSASERFKWIKEVHRRTLERRNQLVKSHQRQMLVSVNNSINNDHEYGVVPHFMESVIDLKRSRRFIKAFQVAITGVSLKPLNPYYYKPFVYCLLPLFLISLYRKIKQPK